MCRFLMFKSKKPQKIEDLLEKFALACRKSKTPDGDWQGDGWGISYLSRENGWVVKKSINPIWEEKDVFKSIPESRFFLVHARSSSFENQRKLIEYNQPFISERYSFVFNGFIRGVSLPFKIKGEIGSQKIWNLLLELLKKETPQNSLLLLKNIILKNSKTVHALNIGLCDGSNIYALCYFESNPDYYSLFSSKDSSNLIISSEKIYGYEFRKLSSGELVIL